MATKKSPYASGFGSNTGEAASLGANNADFFGEGLDTSGGPAAPDAPPVDPYAASRAALDRSATRTANINADRTSTGSGGATTADAVTAFERGNTGGASGAYNSVDDAGRAQFDYMHDLNDVDSVGGFFNSMGERVGVSHAGDAAGLNDGFNIVNPLDFNPLSGVVDPNKGLGTNAGNAGKPLLADHPDLADALSTGILPTAAGAAGDALDQIMGGGGGDNPFDTSGSDRGSGRNYSGDLARVQGKADAAQGLGRDVLSGAVAPGGAGAQQQQDALDAAMNFAKGPRAANDVMTDVQGFLGAPTGPSAAELQLQEGAQGAMSDALALARSGRARDAGSQARNLSQAMAENAATNVDTNRNTALLRAKEAETRRGQDLSALGLKGDLAQGVDQGTLGALGIQGDVASALRGANVTERGQGLDFTKGMEGIATGAETDALKTIPQFEQIRHDDQFELTPQQKLAAAKMGGPADKTTADYVTALLGDVLSVL